MKTRTFRTSFSLAIGVAVFTALSAALPRAAQAQAVDVAVLQSEMTDVKAAIIRMDDKFTKKFERMDERFNSVEKSIVRLDEKMNGLQMQNQFVIIPLLFLTLAALIALLTKGTLWGVAREPKASEASRPAQIPPAQPHSSY